MLYVSALASREIRALLLALRQAEPEIRKQVNNQSKLVVTSIWKQAIAEEASSSFGRTQRARVKVIANTAKASVGSRGVRLSAATTGRPLSGGLNGKTQWQALEFGASESVRTVRGTSKLGKEYSMERNVHAQLDPRKKTGYLFFPAAKATVPRILSLWVQTAVRTLAETVEGK